MKIGVKISLTAFLLFLIVSVIAYAGDAGRESQFSIGSGVRAVGIGGGFVAMADDASTVYWNQAGLAHLEYQEFDFMHVTLFEGTIYDVATYVYPHPWLGGFGISFMRLATNDIIKRVDWVEEDEFGYSISQMIFGYGRTLVAGVSFGTALKIINQSLDNNSTYGFGLDLSLLKPVSDEITAGVIFQDIIAPHLRLNNRTEITPHTIMIGVALHNPLHFRTFESNVNVALEIPDDRSPLIHFGCETIYNRFDLRAGYDRDNLTFGFGFNHHRFRFDYAYRIMDGITDSHRFGLSIKIGTSVSDKIVRENELRDVMGNDLILDDRTRQLNYYKNYADRFYETKELDSALSYYFRALAYQPNNRDIINRIEDITKTHELLASREKIRFSIEKTQQSLLDNYYIRAVEFFEQDQPAVSLALINQALFISADNPKFLSLKKQINETIANRIGDLLTEASRAESDGRLSDAIRIYNRILQLSPDNVIAEEMLNKATLTIDVIKTISRGLESYHRGDYSKARRYFEEVRANDKTNIIAKEYLDKIAVLTGQPESTDQDELKRDVETWKIYLNALRHYQNGEYEEAIKLWKKILEKYPGNEETLENIRQAKLRMTPEE
jgi:tetratricopeptide (TPR) repeat protein